MTFTRDLNVDQWARLVRQDDAPTWEVVVGPWRFALYRVRRVEGDISMAGEPKWAGIVSGPAVEARQGSQRRYMVEAWLHREMSARLAPPGACAKPFRCLRCDARGTCATAHGHTGPCPCVKCGSTKTLRPLQRTIPASKQIVTFIVCRRCMESLPPGVGITEYSRVQVGWTRLGFQAWCARHGLNMLHVDFEGQQHHANLDTEDATPENARPHDRG